LTKERKASLTSAIAKELQVTVLDVKLSFRSGAWSIVDVEVHPAVNQPVLFFDKDPPAGRSVALWVGEATKREERSVEDWALKNAPGIPVQLAKCFAWYVTHARGL